MADIFREVDEDIRHERYQKLWRRYRWYLLGITLALIIAVAAFVIIKEQNEARREDEGRQFAAALGELEAGQPKGAAATFLALADTTDSGYLALARLRAADALVLAGDVTGAVALYDQLSADSRADQLYRELAVLLAAERVLDRAGPDEVMQRLAPLVSGDGPWRPLASELTGIAQMRAGRSDAARDIFAKLSANAGAPGGVRSRAQEFLASLGGPLEPAQSQQSTSSDQQAQPDGAQD
ncbi:MAG: tetratricopeptide repeat protein [Rhodospirillaceae bacterium]|nr:tetratricopeptide repeat protein [Rhodospirillaceae bacterium]